MVKEWPSVSVRSHERSVYSHVLLILALTTGSTISLPPSLLTLSLDLALSPHLHKHSCFSLSTWCLLLPPILEGVRQTTSITKGYQRKNCVIYKGDTAKTANNIMCNLILLLLMLLFKLAVIRKHHATKIILETQNFVQCQSEQHGPNTPWYTKLACF